MALKFFSGVSDSNKEKVRKKLLSNKESKKYEELTEDELKRMHAAYAAMGRKGGEARARQLGHEGYVEMGRKGGQARARQMAGVAPSSKK